MVRFAARSSRINSRGAISRAYRGEAEIFLVHCPETDRIYAVPVDDVPPNDGWLRVDPTENGQVKGIRWARDYELPG